MSLPTAPLPGCAFLRYAEHTHPPSPGSQTPGTIHSMIPHAPVGGRIRTLSSQTSAAILGKPKGKLEYGFAQGRVYVSGCPGHGNANGFEGGIHAAALRVVLISRGGHLLRVERDRLPFHWKGFVPGYWRWSGGPGGKSAQQKSSGCYTDSPQNFPA